MKIMDIPPVQLREAPWNPNSMDPAMLAHLKASVARFTVVRPLVVRHLGSGVYEVIGGNQLLTALRELGNTSGTCVVVDVEDAEARLLSQALNAIHGVDDPGLRAALLRDILKVLPQDVVAAVLPDTTAGLEGLGTVEAADLAKGLKAWEAARHARLKHLQVQLTAEQLAVVEEALARLLENLPCLWKKASDAERRKLLLTMLDAVCVETKEERRVVAIKPKSAFRPLLEIATTREGSGVVLAQQAPAPDNDQTQELLCSWWRRGRDGLHLLNKIPNLLATRNALGMAF